MEEFSVLLVDDEEDFLRTIIKRLAKRGLRIFHSPSSSMSTSNLAF